MMRVAAAVAVVLLGIGTAAHGAVPATVLDKVANARDVRGTLGPTTFHLTPEQIAAARAFVQRLGA